LIVELIKEDSAATSLWAGGETKQYFIYPPGSSYASRNFDIRLSKAASNSDAESKYTDLKNFTRHLVMLEGTAHVYHRGHYSIVMNPYEDIDVFDGAWESSAAGRATDFNMMLGKNFCGKMTVTGKSGHIGFDFDSESYNCDKFITAFFCGSGNAFFIMPDGERITIMKGELLLFEDIKRDFKAELVLEDARLIRMDICGKDRY
jgi:hypothetical protein